MQPDGDESHLPVEVPSSVHWTRLPPLLAVGQSGVSHDPFPEQVKSHLHAELQSTRSHAFGPVQVTRHFESRAQSMSRQAFEPVQLIVQVQPDGQVTFPQPFELVHSTRQVRATSSHVVQSSGQFGTTQ